MGFLVGGGSSDELGFPPHEVGGRLVSRGVVGVPTDFRLLIGTRVRAGETVGTNQNRCACRASDSSKGKSR